MKILYCNILLLLCIWQCVLSCSPSDCDSFDAMYKEFVNPSKDYRPAPLYVWNTHVTTSMIDSTMKELCDKGFGGVFIHPRPGLKNEYLSDDWFTLYTHTIKVAKQLDMNVWIYDENTFPSGFAGGHVNAQMPESYNQGGSISLYRYETLPDSIPNMYLCLKERNGEFVDITSKIEEEKEIKGSYYVYIKNFEPRVAWHGGYSYVDLLHPGVTDKFLEITGTGYQKIAADEFGNTLKGWFTDEPHVGPPNGGIRWTVDLFEQFKKRWGYDLKLHLPSLSLDVGLWRQVRHDYYQTILELFVDRWAKPCYNYCDDNGLIFTGHYWEHAWPEIVYGPDNMAMYAWQHMPGIDMLMNKYTENEPQGQFGNVRSVKEVRSVANQLGQKRVLCETYGASGWEETFEDFKRLGDWQTALGVNFMNQHLSHLSIAGDRKYDCPPSFSGHSPWWDHYRLLNDHFSRLSVATSMGEQLNDILIIEPNTTIWFYYVTWDSRDNLWKIGRNFQQFVTKLEKAQAEYDLGSEYIIKEHGAVDGSLLRIGERSYSTVVIPPMVENVESHTFGLLKEFVTNGGKLLTFSCPTLIDGRESDEISMFFRDKAKVISETLLSDDVIAEHFSSDKFIMKERHGGNVFHQRREYADGQMILLVNTDLEESAVGTICVEGSSVAELNTFNGDKYAYGDYHKMGNKVDINFELQPGGSLLLFVFDSLQGETFQVKVDNSQGKKVPAMKETIHKPSHNVLAVDFCDLQIMNEHHKDMHVFDAAQLVFQKNGFPEGNPWGTAIQYKGNIVCRDTLTGGGFVATYHFVVDDEFDYSSFKAVIERSWLYSLRINGEEIASDFNEWWIDKEFNVLPIGDYIKRGVNDVSISIESMKLDAEIAPVYILGDFKLEPAEKGWKIKRPLPNLAFGSWMEQGMPFYSSYVTYEQRYSLSHKSNRSYSVKLGKWGGTVSEVIVNGKPAGIIAFKPYVLDVTDLMREGDNVIQVRVIGSNKNIFGPFHNESAIGFVTPNLYKGTKEWPSGESYIQMKYGLQEPFSLLEQEI